MQCCWIITVPLHRTSNGSIKCWIGWNCTSLWQLLVAHRCKWKYGRCWTWNKKFSEGWWTAMQTLERCTNRQSHSEMHLPLTNRWIHGDRVFDNRMCWKSLQHLSVLQMTKCDGRSCCKEPRCDLKTIIQRKFLQGPLLTKRSEQSGMQLENIGEEPLKGKRVYTSIMETMALSHLRPKGYGEIKLPYDLYCRSVQKKIAESGGDQYQCAFCGCKKLFTTLDLAKNHLKVRNHKKLARK